MSNGMFEHLKDKFLVFSAKRGDKDSFGKLYQKYLDGIYRYIYFRLSQRREEAEDLTETVFLKAWKSLDTYSENNFRAWLYKIAHNLTIDYFKKEGRRVTLTEEIIDMKQNIEEKILVKDEIESLEKALNILNDDQKAVFTMRYIEDLSNREIAFALGKKEEAIRAIQHRALKKLRKVMGR